MTKELFSPIIKALTAATILLVLISANSMMNYTYAAAKNTPIQNESNLPTPLPLPIPRPGLSVTLEVTTRVLSGNNKPSDFTITVSGNRPSPRRFSGSSSGATVTLKPGKYSVSASYVSGYATTYSPECSGTASGGIPIKCTVTNQYTPLPGSTTYLNVVTKVDNTNGGTKRPSDFTLSLGIVHHQGHFPWVRTNIKPIAKDIVIRNFIEETILLTFLIKDQIDSSSLVTWFLLLVQMIWVILEMFLTTPTPGYNYTTTGCPVHRTVN